MSSSRNTNSVDVATQNQKRTTIEELRKSEAHFRALVEATGDWIWEVSTDGVYTYSSPQVESILGYPPSMSSARHRST